MFYRLILALLFASSLGGCGSDAGFGDYGVDRAESGSTLEILGESSVQLLPRSTLKLEVRYRDERGRPVSGVPVELVFENSVDPLDELGIAPGASLSTDQPLTDEEGIARSVLSVGSEPARFRVRANAQGAEPVYLQVEVLEVDVRTVQIEARYTGLRRVVRRTVTALAELNCAAALAAGVSGEVSLSYEDPKGSVGLELAPGVSYAVVAWGREAKGSKLAQGCEVIDVPEEGDADLGVVLIELSDLPMLLTGVFQDVSINADVAAPVARAAKALRDAGLDALPDTASADGDYLLDQLEAYLRDKARFADADAIAEARVAEADLASSLDAGLEAQGAGPSIWLGGVASLLSSYAQTLHATVTYAAASTPGVPMTLSIAMLSARGQSMNALGLMPEVDDVTASIEALYDDARALVVVSELSIELGLGRYAGLVLTKLGAAKGARLAEQLPTQAGCDVFEAWGAARGSIHDHCDAGCRAAACALAYESLEGSLRAGLVPLDGEHPRLRLGGELDAFDRKIEDGIIDALSATELRGTWAEGDTASDGVSATLETTEESLTL
jgi:hypothetical protein